MANLERKISSKHLPDWNPGCPHTPCVLRFFVYSSLNLVSFLCVLTWFYTALNRYTENNFTLFPPTGDHLLGSPSAWEV